MSEESIKREGLELMIASMYQQGLDAEAAQMEKKHNIYLGKIEGALQAFLTQDEKMIKLKEHVRKLAQVDDCVLIQGETGTGKELIAKALHGNRKGQFVAINCAGLPKELVESELFGHAAGAFTDAKNRRQGLIEQADDGTLLLDEIGDLDLPLQAKLLRCLQEKTYRAVGSNTEMRMTCRIVCATHLNLKMLLSNNLFRRDLFARISTFILQLTPLRDRIKDVPLIVKQMDRAENAFPLSGLVSDKWLKINGGSDNAIPENVRTVQSIVRRWQVLKVLPEELK